MRSCPATGGSQSFSRLVIAVTVLLTLPAFGLASEATTSAPAGLPSQVARWRAVLLGSVLLLLVLIVGALAIIRFSRRYRSYILRRPHEPTPADDVWLLHQLPEESESEPEPPPDSPGESR
jgi:hypothetical protein